MRCDCAGESKTRRIHHETVAGLHCRVRIAAVSALRGLTARAAAPQNPWQVRRAAHPSAKITA